jgi:hypothetical protein
VEILIGLEGETEIENRGINQARCSLNKALFAPEKCDIGVK